MVEKGILYLMSTAVKDVVKFGISKDRESFEKRMADLERDGYYNVSGLKREFAIEIDDYIRNEDLLHRVLNNCRIGTSELFSLKLNEARQLLSALKGTPIWPPNANNEEVFIEATDELDRNYPVIHEKETDDNEEDTDEIKERVEQKKLWNSFKETHFQSSLTGKKYYFPTSSGPLKLYYEGTNDEIENYSNPSKRQIMRQAILDLQLSDLPENFDGKTVYAYAKILEKHKSVEIS